MNCSGFRELMGCDFECCKACHEDDVTRASELAIQGRIAAIAMSEVEYQGESSHVCCTIATWFNAWENKPGEVVCKDVLSQPPGGFYKGFIGSTSVG